jgi:hypothetical protein
MKQESEQDEVKKVGDAIGEMGRERMALRARKTTIVLSQTASLVCLALAAASLTGYIPHAVAPSILLILIATGGFAFSIIEGRSP